MNGRRWLWGVAVAVALLVALLIGLARPPASEIARDPGATGPGPAKPSIERTPAPVVPAGPRVEPREDERNPELEAFARMAEALDGYRIRCPIPPGMWIQAMSAVLVEPATNTVEFVANRPDGETAATGSQQAPRVVTWEGAQKGVVSPCHVDRAPMVDVELRFVWMDDGAPATGLKLTHTRRREGDRWVYDPIPFEDGVARFRAHQFATPTILASFADLPDSPIFQDMGPVIELLVGAPPEEGPLRYTFTVFRPDPEGLTPEMREAMDASVYTTSDLFPPGTYYDEVDLEQAREAARVGAPEDVRVYLAPPALDED